MSNWFTNLFSCKKKTEEVVEKNEDDIIVLRTEFHLMFPEAAASNNWAELYKGLNHVLSEYGIRDTVEVAKFCAQIGHESGDLRFREENLNYSSEALMRVFKKYFDVALAKKYAYDEISIANRVYANRMGNGDEESGDGWRYRGRGFIQLTGKNNYVEYGRHKNMSSMNEIIAYLKTIEGAWDVAGWYYWKNGCIGKSIKEQTKIINGGYNGLKDREERYIDNCYILGV